VLSLVPYINPEPIPLLFPLTTTQTPHPPFFFFFLAGEAEFLKAAEGGNLVPICRRIFSDHLTPVLAYRCLVKEDEREAPSFLFESVENAGGRGQPLRALQLRGGTACPGGGGAGRGSGSGRPRAGDEGAEEGGGPPGVAEELSAGWKPVLTPDLPASFCGETRGVAHGRTQALCSPAVTDPMQRGVEWGTYELIQACVTVSHVAGSWVVYT